MTMSLCEDERPPSMDALEQLDRRMLELERLRLAAGTPAARLVALDVELCRMAAARLMLSADPAALVPMGDPVDDEIAYGLDAPWLDPGSTTD